MLGGEQALQYVRSRTYTELIDGRWRITGGDDFSRIARQQDFLVLALDRAISRGARNPTTIAGMIEAGAAFVTIDQDLTLGELVSLAQDFSDFNPENLQRQRLEVYTLWWPDGRYKGEAALRQANEPILDIFRGEADSLSPFEVSLTVAGFNEFNREDASTSLAGEGFEVLGSLASPAIPETVVLHGPDDEGAAMTVARYLEPVPYVVSDDGVDGVLVVLGADYGGVLFAFQESMSVVRDQVRARGIPPVRPDPAAGFAPVATGSAAQAPATFPARASSPKVRWVRVALLPGVHTSWQPCCPGVRTSWGPRWVRVPSLGAPTSSPRNRLRRMPSRSPSWAVRPRASPVADRDVPAMPAEGTGKLRRSGRGRRRRGGIRRSDHRGVSGSAGPPRGLHRCG